MSSKSVKNPLAIALSTAFAASLGAVSTAGAAENPFGMTELSSGYMVADSHEGKCGEGKKMEKEGKCGEGKKMEMEGKCGESKKMETESKTKKEGKCGEGKCGTAK
jgi:uncharacterized low-complexity protein